MSEINCFDSAIFDGSMKENKQWKHGKTKYQIQYLKLFFQFVSFWYIDKIFDSGQHPNDKSKA